MPGITIFFEASIICFAFFESKFLFSSAIFPSTTNISNNASILFFGSTTRPFLIKMLMNVAPLKLP